MMTIRTRAADYHQAMTEAQAMPVQRLMIIGDSMTQGAEGDYTWRYRFWQWIKSQGIDAVFTGPFEGTQEADVYTPPQPPLSPGEGQLAGPKRHHGPYARDVHKDFDSHHFSEWGKPCFIGASEISKVLTNHKADILLVMLGFNDLGWKLDNVQGTLKNMKLLVDRARQANPELKFVIADIPQRTYMDGRDDLPRNTTEYNARLVDAVPQWTTRQSPVFVAELCKRYTAETAAYDGLHPNALGDYQIAQAFADTFVEKLKLGITSVNIPDNIPQRYLPSPTQLRIVSSPYGVTATWQPVFGSHGYEVKSRINDGDGSVGVTGASRWDSHWATDGDVHEIQIRACYGESKSSWTLPLCATAHPQLAPPPRNVQLQSKEGDLTISFEPPETCLTIIRYAVFYKDKAHPEWFPTVYGFSKSPAYLPADLLESGHVYDVWMSTWTVAEGFWGEMHQIKIS